jgi:hypothetical protein
LARAEFIAHRRNRIGARAYHRCQARFLKQALMHDDFPNPNEHLSRALNEHLSRTAP